MAGKDPRRSRSAEAAQSSIGEGACSTPMDASVSTLPHPNRTDPLLRRNFPLSLRPRAANRRTALLQMPSRPAEVEAVHRVPSFHGLDFDARGRRCIAPRELIDRALARPHAPTRSGVRRGETNRGRSDHDRRSAGAKFVPSSGTRALHRLRDPAGSQPSDDDPAELTGVESYRGPLRTEPDSSRRTELGLSGTCSPHTRDGEGPSVMRARRRRKLTLHACMRTSSGSSRLTRSRRTRSAA